MDSLNFGNKATNYPVDSMPTAGIIAHLTSPLRLTRSYSHAPKPRDMLPFLFRASIFVPTLHPFSLSSSLDFFLKFSHMFVFCVCVGEGMPGKQQHRACSVV